MMNSGVIFCLILALFVPGAQMATISVKNDCPYTIWPATLSVGGGTQLSTTGFELAAGATNSVIAPSPWSGRFWARTQCSSTGTFTCVTGDCGTGQVACNGKGGAPPVSLVEFNIAANKGKDFVDLSLVDGFNLPVSVAPEGSSGANCTPASSGSECAADVNSLCPTELRDPGGCNNPCTVFNNDQFCCFNGDAKCGSTAYSKFFKDLCPSVYTYAYDDDATSRFSCPAGTEYKVVFCPSKPLTRNQISVTNNCPYTIWPATLSGDGGTQLSTTGFELAAAATKSITVRSPWSGRFWARTQCSSNGTFTCATGDCGTGQVECNGNGGAPPVSLVEFTIAANNGQDFFDLSHVDGFNLPVSVTPESGSGATCNQASCTANINGACPAELQVIGSDGSVIGCKSACAAFNQPQYCCTEAYNTPETCLPNSYSQIFEKHCPQAYSYAYDDRNSTFSCTGGGHYSITFCP